MPARAWLTPDSAPTGFICRRLLIPDSLEYVAIVAGCLDLLTFPHNYEQFGTATPKETAAAFQIMFDDFSLKGSCRMVGEIIPYAGAVSPDIRWLECDGSSLLRADYPDLWAVIGATYGAVDGTHFNLPDLKGRAAAGSGAGTGITARAVGDAYGEETHTLTTTELPAHTHTDSGHSHAESTASPSVGAAITGVPVPSAIPGVGVTGSASANLNNTGGDNPHNNLQPTLTILYLIVALP